MKYYQATVTTVSEFADTLSVLLIDYGSEGVTVSDYRDVKDVLATHTWDYADASLLRPSDPTVYVSGYYPEDYDFSALTERLNELRAHPEYNVGALELSLKKIDSADYENEWKKYYEPIELDKIVIVPEWIRYEGDKLPVLLDPGMAFGTGNHETTKLCLRFLEKEDLAGKRCADIGCGSGILGAAALKLGAAYCLMADIDEQAVAATHRNCARNGVEERVDIRLGSLPATEKGFAVIVANITADILITLRDAFRAALDEGGKLIMSGIIHSRADDVKKAYADLFDCLKVERDGEWQGMLWQKRESGR